MKRVSLAVAKAIKEAGYPQLRADSSYGVIDGELFNIVADDDYFISAPYAMDVWLWLWREKKIYFGIEAESYPHDGMCVSSYVDFPYSDPEEAIIAAIDYLAENNLIK